MDRATFWSTQSPDPVFEAVTFEHPALAGGAVRLVANVFEPVVLGGYSHIPAAMSIKPPEPSAEGAKSTLAFPAAAVDPDTGLTVRRLFKRALREIQAGGSLDPITVRYSVYMGDTGAPEVEHLLYVSDQGGVTFNADTVQVTATVPNPMRRSAAEIYTPDVFTGLELVA